MTQMQSNAQPFLASFDARPLLVSQDGATFFKASIDFVLAHEHSEAMTADMNTVASVDDDEFWAEDDWRSMLRPYVVVKGVLQVPVQGTLLNRFPYQLGRWATGYDYIERAVMRGMEDPEVRAIALVIDSVGGEVAGCFELVDKLHDMRGTKPIRSFAADHAYSAAYALASVGDEITVTRSGGTGSVGVVTMHINAEKAMDRMGVEVTLIHAGKHKVDGNSYEKLPDAVKQRIQARVDKIYGVFTSTVARNRGMDEDAIKGTEALTYDAEDSIEIGFADRIGALDDEMIAFTEEVAEEEDIQMTTKPKTTVAEATQDDTVAKATYDADVATATTSGETAGRQAEKERATAILGSDAGKARPKAALSAVLNTDMTVEQATAFLADLPEEAKATAEAPKADAPEATATPFGATMDADGHPNVGATAESASGEEANSADSIIADFQALTGAGKKRA